MGSLDGDALDNLNRTHHFKNDSKTRMLQVTAYTGHNRTEIIAAGKMSRGMHTQYKSSLLMASLAVMKRMS